MFGLINGIGEKLEGQLIEKYGSPKTLSEAYDLLQGLELPKATEQDAKYRPMKIIPRNIIEYIEQDFKSISVPHIICGSYRRLAPMSGDIDIVVVGDVQQMIKQINKLYKVIDPYAAGADRMSCLLEISWLRRPIYVKMDLFTANEDNYAYMIYYATGSKRYNIKMRIVARKKGLLLNQYGLFTKNNELVPAKTEKDICNILGVLYLEPYERL